MLVPLHSRNDTTNTSSWVVRIAVSSRNEMDVAMHYRLPRGPTGIDADIKPTNSRILIKNFFTQIFDEDIALSNLTLGQFEPRGFMSSRNYQVMPWSYREPVFDHICQFGLFNDRPLG